ncbi:signal recognition particle-docking protein FtsY [bacterium]|nr:signal recognition particle-docking protein FtsY [bacterium]
MLQALPIEVFFAAGASLSIAVLYFALFRKPRKKEGPSQAKQEFEELKKAVAEKEKPLKNYKTLQEALAQTQKSLWGRMSASLSGATFDRSQLESIEEVLYTSDLGPKTVQRLFSSLESKLTQSLNGEGLKQALRKEMLEIFLNVKADESQFKIMPEGLTVWMVVGVNGAGKTTTIGKLASQLQQHGKKVMIAAGDTFRAAADAQLKVWSERANVEIFSPENVKDPSAVAFESVNKAQAKGFDVLIVDTAGRLHTQTNLMEELKKIKRVMGKVNATAPHEVVLVLDANSGQNALIQAEQFHQALGVTGVILTKMDGSAKGGVAIGVACDVGLPVKMIGVGEAVEDLRPFSPQDFVDSIL